jgi:glycosyltransferase involved in cell wall biosynthesis
MLEIEKKFNLPKKYLFYPAMYLPHKNHKSLVDALKILKFDYNLDINIVCTGSDVGYLSEIKEYSIKNKVNNNIFFLDFVDNKALPYLYLNSIALIFPVLAGPTFTPPWEAFKMGVPVIFSNLLGVKNVYKDAVYYIDPLDSYSIANSVIILLENNSVRENLITRGREILKELNDKNEYGQLFFIIKHYRKINQTWNFEKP